MAFTLMETATLYDLDELFKTPSALPVSSNGLSEGWMHRLHAEGDQCPGCGCYSWDPERGGHPPFGCVHYVDSSAAFLSARNKQPELQRKSEIMADIWPFGRRAALQ